MNLKPCTLVAGLYFFRKIYISAFVHYKEHILINHPYKLQKVTKNHDTCEEWKRKSGKITRDFNKEVASEVVTKMAKDILIIAQILCDDKIDEREESK